MGIEGGPEGQVSKLKQIAKGNVDDIAAERESLNSSNPLDEKEREEASRKADALLDDAPPAFEVVQMDATGNKIKLPEGQRIIRLPDGQYGVFVLEPGIVFVKKQNSMINMYAKYGDQPFKEERLVSLSKLSDRFPEAYTIIQALSEKAKVKIPDRINPDQEVIMIKSARETGGRAIVKLTETGVLAIDHAGRNSYLVEYNGKIIEYDAKTGEKFSTSEASSLTGATHDAYQVMKSLESKV